MAAPSVYVISHASFIMTATGCHLAGEGEESISGQVRQLVVPNSFDGDLLAAKRALPSILRHLDHAMRPPPPLPAAVWDDEATGAVLL